MGKQNMGHNHDVVSSSLAQTTKEKVPESLEITGSQGFFFCDIEQSSRLQ